MELFPLFLGGLFCIVCAVIGLVKLMAPGSRPRWHGLVILLVGLLGLFPFLPILPQRHITAKQISGTYDGEYAGGYETIIIRPNGTLTQTFVVDGKTKYTNMANWKIAPNNELEFDHLMKPWSSFGSKDASTPSDYSGAYVRAFDSAIVFDDDRDIHWSPSATEDGSQRRTGT